MKVVAVGCSGSGPGPQSPASCYLVQAVDSTGEYGDAGRVWSIVLDLGNGSLGALQRHIDPATLDAVVLSHLHPDHCLDVCSLYVQLKYSPLVTRDDPMLVYGPAGVGQRLARAYGVTEAEPIDDLFSLSELAERTAFRIGPLEVTPYRVNHPVETYGVRVVADGVLAYTGDTDACAALSPLMTGADLVLADCAFVDGLDDRRDIHLTGSRAAAAARAAGGVRRLLLTHIPAWSDPAVCLAQARSEWDGDIDVCGPEAAYDVVTPPA